MVAVVLLLVLQIVWLCVVLIVLLLLLLLRIAIAHPIVAATAATTIAWIIIHVSGTTATTGICVFDSGCRVCMGVRCGLLQLHSASASKVGIRLFLLPVSVSGLASVVDGVAVVIATSMLLVLVLMMMMFLIAIAVTVRVVRCHGIQRRGRVGVVQRCVVRLEVSGCIGIGICIGIRVTRRRRLTILVVGKVVVVVIAVRVRIAVILVVATGTTPIRRGITVVRVIVVIIVIIVITCSLFGTTASSIVVRWCSCCRTIVVCAGNSRGLVVVTVTVTVTVSIGVAITGTGGFFLLFENTGPSFRVLLFLLAETASRFGSTGFNLAVVAPSGTVRNIAAGALHDFDFSVLRAAPLGVRVDVRSSIGNCIGIGSATRSVAGIAIVAGSTTRGRRQRGRRKIHLEEGRA
mmetsp:Transcript_15141/g.31277  ORF Transcript_15141/g.31277 Transcript_15141/m.31277 type:complete len:405 (-) Transcript_15141:1029-2243(-)